jgi:hypothetical protein
MDKLVSINDEYIVIDRNNYSYGLELMYGEYGCIDTLKEDLREEEITYMEYQACITLLLLGGYINETDIDV